jgi:hypothetical protein
LPSLGGRPGNAHNGSHRFPIERSTEELPTMHRYLIAACGLSLLTSVIASSARAADKPDRYFEMRTYVANDGKFQDLHSRFRDHTNKLFIKHGMELVGYWVPAEGPESENTLVYILAYPSREARETSWKAFIADPEWHKARDASEANGKLVKKVESKFLTPTDYSPIK